MSSVTKQVVAGCMIAVISASAMASLKEKPPKGVDLSNTTWQIDPYRSDDPTAVLDQARSEMQEKGGGRGGGMRRRG